MDPSHQISDLEVSQTYLQELGVILSWARRALEQKIEIAPRLVGWENMYNTFRAMGIVNTWQIELDEYLEQRQYV